MIDCKRLAKVFFVRVWNGPQWTPKISGGELAQTRKLAKKANVISAKGRNLSRKCRVLGNDL
jgi:hypothetical protein